MLRRLVRPRPGALPRGVSAAPTWSRPASPVSHQPPPPPLVLLVVARGLAGRPDWGERADDGATTTVIRPRAAGARSGRRDGAAMAEEYDGRRLKAVRAARQGQLEAAWAQLGKIEHTGWQPRKNKPPLAHVGVAVELLKRGHVEEAVLALRRLAQVKGADPASGAPFRIVMNAAAKRGDARAALRLLEEMKAQGLPITALGYNHALHACAKAHSPSSSGRGADVDYLAEARALFEEMLREGPEPTLVNYNTFLLVLARNGQVEEARALLTRMVGAGLRPDVVSYNTALAAGAAAGAWLQVRELLRAMEAEGGLSPDVVSYNTAMSTFQQIPGSAPALEERAALALALLDEMRDKGLRPDIVTYNILVDVCSKAGRLEAARSLLEAMVAEGQRPDRVTYNALAQGYVRARRFEEAWDLLEQLRREGLQPDGFTRRMVLTALAGLGRDAEVAASVRALRDGREAAEMALLAMVGSFRTQDGIAFVRRLEEDGAGELTANAFFSAVKECRAIEDLEGGTALLAEAQRRRLPITTPLVLPLIKLGAQLHAWAQVLSLLELLERSPGGCLDLALHNTRLRALAQLGNVEGCRAALAAMRAQGVDPNGESYSWTLRAERAGGVDNAGGIRRMLHEARSGSLTLTQELALAQLAALRQVGDWRGLLSLLNRIAEGHYPGVRLTTVMANHALATLDQRNMWGTSLELIARMRSGELGDVPPDAVTYLNEMVALGQLGRWEEAVALLHRIREGAAVGGPGGDDVVTPQEGMYTAAAAACARAGRLAEAREVHALRTADGFMPTLHSLNALLQAHARLGQVEEARRVLDGIAAQTGEAPDVVSYNSLIQAHRERGTPLGDPDGVLGVYRRLLASATDEGDKGLQPDATTFTALLAACVPAGQWPVALYLHGEAQFLLGGTSGRGLIRSARDARLDVLRALLAALEALGVDGLFAARAYGEAARSWRGCISHWAKQRDGGWPALDFHTFSRSMAKAALAHVLERDFVAAAAAGKKPPEAIRPLVIIVGRGRHSQSQDPKGEPVLKDELQRFLAALDPPVHAVTPPHNAGRLVVSAGQLRAYVEAQLHLSRDV